MTEVCGHLEVSAGDCYERVIFQKVAVTPC